MKALDPRKMLGESFTVNGESVQRMMADFKRCKDEHTWVN